MKKLVKRISTFLLVVSMAILPMNVVHAAEETDLPTIEASDCVIVVPPSSEGSNIYEYTIDVGGGIEAQSDNNKLEQGVVWAGEYTDFYPTLGNYVGLNKTFVATAVSDCTEGAMWLYLYNPDGKLVSYDWVLGYNEAYSWSVFLPKAGTWRCRVVGAGTNAPVTMTLGWR